MAKIRILIVDDHAILRSGLKKLIGSQDDMEVVGEAETRDQAIELARALQPEVMLLDISMPGGTGIQAIAAVRDVSPQTRIVILTMHDDHAYLRSALASGASGYMVKTGADTELLTAIRTVHGGRTYVDVSLEDAARDTTAARRRTERRVGSKISLDVLSAREHQVLGLVAYGYTHKEIAERLSVSVKSIETYRARLVDKLGLRSRADLVRYALDNDILGPDKTPLPGATVPTPSR